MISIHFNRKRTVGLCFFIVLFFLLVMVGLFGCNPQTNNLQPRVTQTLEPGSIKNHSKDGMAQVYIPAGEFMMGSTNTDIDQIMKKCSNCSFDWFNNEIPQHKVFLDAFWIDKTEVTNAMFARFVADSGYKTDAEIIGGGITFNLLSRDWKMTQGANWQHPHGPTTDIQGIENHPVVHMTYKDAQTYCQWAGRRMVTEAEWEKAARGTDGRIYPWGNQPPTGTLVNYADRNAYEYESNINEDDGYTFTAPVGSYPDGASPYGVLDMAGNTWERVADWYSDKYYINSPVQNPTGPSSGEYVVIRGGSWSRMDRYLRVSSRYRYRQENRSAGLGFRCAESTGSGLQSPASIISNLIPTLLPLKPISETYMKDFTISTFDAVHEPINQDTNKYLIFGHIQSDSPKAQQSDNLTAFLGRWEGYNFGLPVKKDMKYVLVIYEINAQDGKALLWAGTNLQYPKWVKEINFRVLNGEKPAIEWLFTEGDKQSTFIFTLDQTRNLLQGWQKEPITHNNNGPIELSRDRSFPVYKDYKNYLAGLGIYPKEYHNKVIPLFYGKGYLVYLPKDYESNPQQDWPLIIFLHGSGDRGENPYLLAKASPFMYIREMGPLPFIIVAPLLNNSQDYASFPDNYLKGVLEEALADYRIDPKRIYVTGLSMGGEATYRFASLQPNRIAAIAPLSAFIYSSLDIKAIKNVPVWAIHGDNDPVISLSTGRKPVDLLNQAGGNVQFTILKDHDHDTWTDTYSDPQFYEWLLNHQKP